MAVSLAITAFAANAQPVDPSGTDEGTRNAARELARDAVSAYDEKNYARALDLIDRAYKLVPAPTISIWQARILAKMQRLIEANERYEITRRTKLPPDAPPAFRAAVSEAGQEVEALRQRIPRIRVKVTGAEANSTSLRVTLDGKPVPPELVGVLRTVDPGVHQLEARVPGIGSAQRRIEVKEGERKDVELELAPVDVGGRQQGDQPEAGGAGWSARKTWSVVAASIGVAGVGTGIGFGLAANQKHSTLKDSCSGNSCPPSASGDLDSFRTDRTISWIGYGVGAAGLATAAVLVFVVKDRPTRVGVAPYVGIGAAGVGGTF